MEKRDREERGEGYGALRGLGEGESRKRRGRKRGSRRRGRVREGGDQQRKAAGELRSEWEVLS